MDSNGTEGQCVNCSGTGLDPNRMPGSTALCLVCTTSVPSVSKLQFYGVSRYDDQLIPAEYIEPLPVSQWVSAKQAKELEAERDYYKSLVESDQEHFSRLVDRMYGEIALSDEQKAEIESMIHRSDHGK